MTSTPSITLAATLRWQARIRSSGATLACVLLGIAFAGCTSAQTPVPADTPTTTTRPTEATDAAAVRARAFRAEVDGDHATAAEAFLQLTQLETGKPEWYQRAAENLGKVGRYNDAMDLLESAHERFPDVPELVVALAQTFHLKADQMLAEGPFDVNVAFYYQDVSRALAPILEAAPTHLRALLLVASAKFQLGELEAALSHAERAVASHAADYGAHAMLGKVTFQMFVNRKQRFQQEQPTGGVASEQLAAIATARTRAEAALAAAAKADPTRSFPLGKLGDIDAWDGAIDAALEHYRAAMIVEPAVNIDHDWLRTTLEAARRIEFYAATLEAYRKRPDAAPREAAVIDWYLARSHFDAEHWSEARKSFAAVLELRPDFVTTLGYLMEAAYWDGDEGDAIAHAHAFAQREPRKFADTIRREPRTIAILRGLASNCYRDGQLVPCRDFNHVLALAFDSADEWNNYALLCRDTQRYDDSYAAYERALAIETSPQLLNDAAVILQYHLRTPENLTRARDYYERAIGLAERMLADDTLSDDVRERTRIALRDARMNLGRM